MRADFNPADLRLPVRTYDLDVDGTPAQLAISKHGLIAVAVSNPDCDEGKMYIFDSQYKRLGCFNVNKKDEFEGSYPMQLCFDPTTGSLLTAYANISDFDSDDEDGYLIRGNLSDKVGFYQFNLNGKCLPFPNVGNALNLDYIKLSTTLGVTCNHKGEVFFTFAYGNEIPTQCICKVSKKLKEVSIFHTWDSGVDGYDSDSDCDIDLHYQLCFGPDGSLYAGHPRGIDVMDDKGIRQATIATEIMDFMESSGAGICLVASQDGKLFMSQNSSEIHVLSLDGSVLGVAECPDGGWYTSLAIDNNGYLHVLEPESGKVHLY